MKQSTFFIQTYGCQMNVADSEMVAGILIKAGYTPVDNIDKADIILFNSCTVRQHAEDRVVGRITQESKRKEQKKNLLIGLIGCVAQRCGNELVEKISGLDFALGTDQYLHIPDVIDACNKRHTSIALTEQNHTENYVQIYPYRRTGVNAFVTIMRGCDNFCTYCIVPYVRGRERSRDYREILEEVENAGKNGFKDVTLLGQNVNSYHDGTLDFPDLLRKAAHVKSIERLRFVTSHPKDLSDKLIEVMATEAKICEYLHLPLQSGSNTILKAMNRRYTSEHYMSIIKKLRKAIPHIALSTDVMVGFPSETEDDFMETYNMLKEIRYDYAFTFKYSPRIGTKAAEYTNQIDEEIRLKRLQRIIELQETITREKYQEQIGRDVEVYVEQISKKDTSELSGRTRDNKVAVFPGDPSLINKLVPIKIIDAVGWTLKGRLIDK